MTVIEFMRAIRETNPGPGDTIEDRATLQNRPVHIRPDLTLYDREDRKRLALLATWPLRAAQVETVGEAAALVLEPEEQKHPHISLKIDGNESPTALALVAQLEKLLKDGGIEKTAEVYVRTGDPAVQVETNAVQTVEPTVVTKRNARLLAA